MITTKNISRFVELTKLAQYNEELKEEYKRLGRKILKHIAEQMQLPKDSYDIRWNPGGIALSGDHTLHTDKVYVALHDNIGSGWFYWRLCSGRKDYSGGQNQIVYWNKLKAPGGLDKLISALKLAQAGGYKESNGDFNMNVHLVLRKTAELMS